MKFLPCAATFLLLSASAFAQAPAPAKVFTPAPVPNLDNGNVTPADRAGPIGNDAASPFAGVPVTLEPGAGQPTPITRSTGGSTLTAPAPNLGK